MAEKKNNTRRSASFDTPLVTRRRLPRVTIDAETFGVISERLARFMGTPAFLLWMTIICAFWLTWNSVMPVHLQWDQRALNFTLLTLILSLQASYAAPLLLLAQNRQDDRDRVNLEQDRRRAERTMADTEFLTREIASLRLGLREVATRDYVRSELRDLISDIDAAHRDELKELLRAEVRAELEAERRTRPGTPSHHDSADGTNTDGRDSMDGTDPENGTDSTTKGDTTQ